MVLFSDLFDTIRAVSGNDDLDLGAEILPDTRLVTLIKTAILTLPTYSAVFPTLAYSQDASNNWQFYMTADPSADINPAVVQAVVHVAAHKYYSGIGHKEGMEATTAAIYKCSENFAGMALDAVDATATTS